MEQMTEVESSEKLHTLKYRPEIDGLRAVAILPVMLYHLGLGFPGGFVGVDVFFVISGFLISGIIINQIDKGTFSIWNFWERRIRRIFPPLILVVVTTLIAGYFLHNPIEYEDLAYSTLAQSFFSANIYYLFSSGYFDTSAETKPLLHLWSLAVEEQFYFILPFLLMYYWRKNKSFCRWMIVFLFFLSFILSCIFVEIEQGAAFYLLPNRAWELLIGVIIWFLPNRLLVEGKLAEILSFIGFSMIIIASVILSNDTKFPGIPALLPCLGAAFIIIANIKRITLIGKFLSLKPIVFIGLISYSLYLWHWPLIVFAKLINQGALSFSTSLYILFISLFLSIVNWALLESPFRTKLLFPKSYQLFTAAGISIVLLVSYSIFVIKTNGYPKRLSQNILELIDLKNERISIKNKTINQVQNDDLNRLGNWNSPDSKNTFLIWGDSHAGNLWMVADEVAQEMNVNGFIIFKGGYPPLLNVWTELNRGNELKLSQEVMNVIQRHKVKNVIIVCRWNAYLGIKFPNLLINDNTKVPSIEDSRTVLNDSLNSTVNYLEQQGVNVWLVKSFPTQKVNVPQWISINYRLGIDPSKATESVAINRATHYRNQQYVEQAFSKIDSETVHFLDPAPYLFDPKGYSFLIYQGKTVYVDDNHLSISGSQLIKPMMIDFFEQIKKQSVLKEQ